MQAPPAPGRIVAQDEAKRKIVRRRLAWARLVAVNEELSYRDPKEYSLEEILVLIRAVKVQSQVLQLYVGQPSLDV